MHTWNIYEKLFVNQHIRGYMSFQPRHDVDIDEKRL